MHKILQFFSRISVLARSGEEPSTPSERLLRGAFWSIFSHFGSKIITMGGAILIARMLGPKGNGELAMVQSTIGMLGVFGGLGLGTICTKFIAEYKKKNPQKVSNIVLFSILLSIITGCILTVLCIVFSDYISANILKNSNLSSYFIIGSFLLIFSTLLGVLNSSLVGFEAFKTKTNLTLFNGLVTVILSVLFIFYWDLTGAILALIITSLIMLPLYLKALIKESKNNQIRLIFSKQIFNDLSPIWTFGLLSFISGLLIVTVSWWMNIILAAQENGYHSLGIFNVANQWRLSLTALVTALSSAMLPILADLQGRNNQKWFDDALSNNIRISVCVTLPMAIFWIAVARPFALLYGIEFAGVEEIFALLLIPFFFNAIGIPLGMAIVSKGRMGIFTCLNLFWGVIAILLSYILCPIYGAKGLALTYIISHFLHILLKMTYLNIVLSPGVILKNCYLIIFSLTILTTTIFVWYLQEYSSTMFVILVLISSIPLIMEGKKHVLSIP